MGAASFSLVGTKIVVPGQRFGQQKAVRQRRCDSVGVMAWQIIEVKFAKKVRSLVYACQLVTYGERICLRVGRTIYGTEGFWFESRWVYLESLQFAGFFRFL